MASPVKHPVWDMKKLSNWVWRWRQKLKIVDDFVHCFDIFNVSFFSSFDYSKLFLLSGAIANSGTPTASSNFFLRPLHTSHQSIIWGPIHIISKNLSLIWPRRRCDLVPLNQIISKVHYFVEKEEYLNWRNFWLVPVWQFDNIDKFETVMLWQWDNLSTYEALILYTFTYIIIEISISCYHPHNFHLCKAPDEIILPDKKVRDLNISQLFILRNFRLR